MTTPEPDWLPPRLRAFLRTPFAIPVLAQAVLLPLALRHPARLLIGSDSSLFAYMGDAFVTAGKVPYADVWDIKPPLAYLVPIGVSTVTGGDPISTYAVLVGLSILLWIALGWIVIRFAGEITGSTTAMYASALMFSLWPAFAAFPYRGFRPKIAVLLFGLLGVWFALKSRPLLAGAAATIAPGFWQFAAIFPILALALVYHRDGPRAAATAALSAGAVTGLVILPFVLWGATDAMLVQTIIVPLAASEHTSLLERIHTIRVVYQFVGIIAAAGGIGALLTFTRRRHRWLAVAGIYFGLQWFFDLDHTGDLIPFYVIATLGIAVVVDELSARNQRRVIAVICVLVVPELALALADGAIHTVTSPGDVAPVTQAFFSETVLDGCHIYHSSAEQQWLSLTGRDPTATTCGPYQPIQLAHKYVL